MRMALTMVLAQIQFRPPSSGFCLCTIEIGTRVCQGQLRASPQFFPLSKIPFLHRAFFSDQSRGNISLVPP